MSVATLTLVVLTLTGAHTVALRSDKPFVTPRDSARIELRVLDEAGRPLEAASVSLSVNVGSVTEPVATPGGEFVATYRPPAQAGPQVALFHAVVRSGAAAGSLGWLALPVHGRQQLRVQARPRARVSVSVGAASFGPVTAGADGSATVLVEAPPGASSAEATIRERSGRRRKLQLALPEARFARARLVLPTEAPNWQEPVLLQGFVVDEHGNPAASLPPLSVSVDRGMLGPIEPLEGATFQVPYAAPAEAGAPVTVSAATLEDPESASTLQLEPQPRALAQAESGSNEEPPPSAEGAAVSASGPPPARPPLQPWQPSVGLVLFGQSNVALSNGLGARLEGALRLAELPWEALLVVEGRQNRTETQQLSPAGASLVQQSFTLRGGSVRAGARWSQPFLGQGVLFADVSAGLLVMTGSVQVVAQESSLTQPLHSRGLVLSAGGGLGWPLGWGRLLGQVQVALAPGQEKVRGNLGGLSLGLGYQLPLFGGAAP